MCRCESPYMQWAKQHAGAPFNLANSGVAPVSLAEFDWSAEDLELSGPSAYGYAPLQAALARHLGVAPAAIVTATGTSMANHLVMAALVRPGEAVVVEQPTYACVVDTARYLGAEVRRVQRPRALGYQLDLEDLERQLRRRPRLLVLTDLHNPSSAALEEAAWGRVAALAREYGTRVLVDEVYLEARFGEPARSAARFGREFVVTSSLTKVYGLGGLRCGWMVADPALARRLWRLQDLYGVIPAHPAERLSVVALRQLPRLAARAQTLLETNRALFREFLATQPRLELALPSHGTVAFARLRAAQVGQFCDRLRRDYDTSVTPGRFFGDPRGIRIGLGALPERFAAGLDRLGQALARLG